MASQRDELWAALPESARKHADAASPLPMRIMAAKGMAPLPPVELIMVMSIHSLDADPSVAAAAKAALTALPDKIFNVALSSNLAAAALTVLGPLLAERAELLERVVLNKATPDEAIAAIALSAPAKVVEIIAANQERALRSELLVRNLAKNPNIMRSSLDMLFDFLVRAGVIHADMPEFVAAIERLSPTEVETAVAKVELPAELQEYMRDGETVEERAEAAARALETNPTEAQEKIPLLKLITRLNVAQRVALAIRGNREARSILLRDSNRVVATAAIRSPRVTEQEVQGAALSRSVCEDVIRIISHSKEMTRTYAVKVALVQNPKTPMPIAMRLLTLLRENDVKLVAKSKNVSAAIANHAKRMMAQKASGGHKD